MARQGQAATASASGLASKVPPSVTQPRNAGLLQNKEWLRERLSGCFVEDWDAHGAQAVSAPALSSAAAFLTRLDRHAAGPPAVEADNDGWVTLEWYLSSDNVVHLSFGPTDVSTFASRLQGMRCHGEFKATSRQIDERVMVLLRQYAAVAAQANANRRS